MSKLKSGDAQDVTPHTGGATSPTAKLGAEDAGRYFRYMSEFVGFTAADGETIRKTKPIIEKHLPEIVAQFYEHLLRYPPTRKVFLDKHGNVDTAYVELRMRHLTNFWLRTASGEYGDDYARYVDYVGRAHTSHGADPNIYIAERYVIGQVGFVQHAISAILMKELSHIDEEFEDAAVEAWDKLMMVILEMLSRAYGNEREIETFDPLVPVDAAAVARLAQQAFELEHDKSAAPAVKEAVVARAADIPEGERKLVTVGPLSIGVFHHDGRWFALRNSCLHRGGPVATGPIDGHTLVCPWHGFQYDLSTGRLLIDPSARLDTYPVVIENDEVRVRVPESAVMAAPAPDRPQPQALPDGCFRADELKAGQIKLVQFNGRNVAVYNVDGTLYATQDECTHEDGPLSEGDLAGPVVSCPWHGSCFDVRTGQVTCGPATEPVKTYPVTVTDGVASIGTLEQA